MIAKAVCNADAHGTATAFIEAISILTIINECNDGTHDEWQVYPRASGFGDGATDAYMQLRVPL